MTRASQSARTSPLSWSRWCHGCVRLLAVRRWPKRSLFSRQRTTGSPSFRGSGFFLVTAISIPECSFSSSRDSADTTHTSSALITFRELAAGHIAHLSEVTVVIHGDEEDSVVEVTEVSSHLSLRTRDQVMWLQRLFQVMWLQRLFRLLCSVR